MKAEDVACPHCEAAIGETCLTPQGDDAKRPHAKRVKAVERVKREREQGITIPARILALKSSDDDSDSRRWHRTYRACRLELEQRGDWTHLAEQQLTAMVLNMAHADKARASASNDPVTQGSTGQPAPNGLWRVATSLDERALSYAKALKLTPDTRAGSAPETGDVDPDGEDERDEFADLDELAAKRKAKRAGRRGRQ